MKQIIEKICEPYKNQCDITITDNDIEYKIMLNNFWIPEEINYESFF